MRGAFILRSRDCIESRYSSKLGPSHQGHTFLSTRSFKLCPLYAEIGMKNKSVLGLNPFPFKKVPNRFVHSSNLSVSISVKEGVDSPFFTPLNGRIIHLVDDDNKFIDPLHFRKNCMFPRLSAFIKPSLKLSLSSTDDKNANISL